MVKGGGVFDLGFLDSRDDNLAFYCTMVLFCCAMSATAAGLTMAYLSLDKTKLRIIQRNGTELEKAQVATVLPLLMDHHRLLVTLLLSNTLSNEALPIFLDSLVPSWLALVISVTAVTILCEIIPQSVSTGKHKLFVACKCAPLMNLVLWLAYPIAYPAARLLDRFIVNETPHSGQEKKKSLDSLILFTKEELLSMVEILKEAEHADIIAQEGHSFSSDTRRNSSGDDRIPNPIASASPPLHTVSSQTNLVEVHARL